MKILESSEASDHSKPWILLAGEQNLAVEELLRERLDARLGSAVFSAKDVEYVRKLKRPIYADSSVASSAASLVIRDELLEGLRNAAKLSEITLTPPRISSHRPVIGPVIVGIKRMLYPVLKVLLKDLIRQQREFNYSVVLLLATLSSRSPGDQDLEKQPNEADEDGQPTN